MPPETVPGVCLVPTQEKHSTGPHEGAVQGAGLLAALPYLCSIHVQDHPAAVVGGHQMSPDVGTIVLMTCDSGGSRVAVCPEGKEIPAIFSPSWLRCPNTNRPPFLTQRVRTVVKHS